MALISRGLQTLVSHNVSIVVYSRRVSKGGLCYKKKGCNKSFQNNLLSKRNDCCLRPTRSSYMRIRYGSHQMRNFSCLWDILIKRIAKKTSYRKKESTPPQKWCQKMSLQKYKKPSAKPHQATQALWQERDQPPLSTHSHLSYCFSVSCYPHKGHFPTKAQRLQD